MLSEALIALASAGGIAIVEAAASDAWQKAKEGFAGMLGRGNDRQIAVVGERLENTRSSLLKLSGSELEHAQDTQSAEWATRLRDNLEEDPDSSEILRAILRGLAESGVIASVEAKGHSVAAAGNVANVATSGGISATLIHGDVSTSANPPRPEAERS
jgi:hypothetical protein